MIEMKSALLAFDEIAHAVDGELIKSTESPERVENVQINSGQCGQGSLFVPLKGEKTDGHFFIKDALSQGSSLCFVNRQFFLNNQATFKNIAPALLSRLMLVPNTLWALQRLAARYMEVRSRATVIGITGSNGKTTTKEILGAILGEYTNVCINPGNLNSDIGLPLACFRVEEEHRIAVFELGMNRRGEIDELADIVQPQLAAITNIGHAHIGLIGSRQAIAREKRQIFKYFGDDSAGFVHEGELYLPFLRKGREQQIKTYGENSTPGFVKARSMGLDGTEIEWEGRKIRFPLVGDHNLQNALCAVSIAQKMGVPGQAIHAGLEKTRPLSGRAQVLKGAITLIHDCYNANADSVIPVLDFVRSLSWTGRKILVLGSMKELGNESDQAHRLVGGKAADSAFSRVFFFGEESALAYEAALAIRSDGVEWTDNYDFLRQKLKSCLKRGDLVLLKGSRSLEMERFIDVITGASC